MSDTRDDPPPYTSTFYPHSTRKHSLSDKSGAAVFELPLYGYTAQDPQIPCPSDIDYEEDNTSRRDSESSEKPPPMVPLVPLRRTEEECELPS